MNESESYFDFSIKKTENPKKHLFEKINKIMCWSGLTENDSAERIFTDNGGNVNNIPCDEIVDIVYVGDLKTWAEQQNVESQEELNSKLINVTGKILNDKILNDKKRQVDFPRLLNTFLALQKLDRTMKLISEVNSIADIVWNQTICRRNTKRRADAMFGNPDKKRYQAAEMRVRQVYGMTEKEIDAIRYFVCQSRHENHNPSLNKSIYHWGDEKQTGKTTVAKMIVAILNGDTWENAGKYMSTISREMQYNDHDLPMAALYNSVVLDEAMPKDTAKAYGGIKSMLTGDSANYNPKFKSIISVKCKRYYYLTSNNDIIEIIQDKKERRFIEIKGRKLRQKMDFPEIYELWKEFCINCEPEENWQDWYNSFEFVDGLESKNIEDMKVEISIKRDSLFGTIGTGQITPFGVEKILFGFHKPENHKIIIQAMAKLFEGCSAPSNPSIYNINQCRARLQENDEKEGKEVNDDDFPF